MASYASSAFCLAFAAAFHSFIISSSTEDIGVIATMPPLGDEVAHPMVLVVFSARSLVREKFSATI